MSRARDRADGVLHNRTHEDTDGGRESLITFKGEQSGGEISTLAQIQASHDGTSDDEKADLIFKTNDGSDGASPTERVRVDSAGFVGINESSPSGTLHVKGTSAAHGKVIIEAGGSGGSANNNFIEFNKHDGTKLAEIEVGESVTNGGDIIFKTTPTGGSVTNRIRLRHDGGICFGTDNAEANALDDYEEGTWTPDVDGGGVSWQYQSGVYTKIGKVVTITFWLQAAGSSSTSGDVIITGLPFATNSVGRHVAVVRAYNLNNFSGKQGIVGWLSGTSTSVNITAVSGGLVEGSRLNRNVWQAGAEIHFSLTYNT